MRALTHTCAYIHIYNTYVCVFIYSHIYFRMNATYVCSYRHLSHRARLMSSPTVLTGVTDTIWTHKSPETIKITVY